jgi:hypothetical protein
MKSSSFLLAGSLVANVALGAMLLLRSSGPRENQDVSSVPSARVTGSNANSSPAALQSALVAGDSAALTAAGVPAEVVRAIAVGRAFEQMQRRMRELRPEIADEEKYWRRNSGMRSDAMNRERRLEMNKVQRDFAEAIRAAVGDESDSLLGERGDTRFTFLPAAKRDQLRQIQQDYGEMESQAYAEQEGIQLPSDREKLRLLRLERERDIAAALTPEQREQYELRLSQTANQVRSRYGEVIQSEEEYRRIFALQKAFDDQYAASEMLGGGSSSQETTRARREAEQKLQEEIRASLDPTQLATWLRANDQDHKTVSSLARRLNLPADTPDLVLASREVYATQSMQINANPALSADERRSQIQALAAKAQNELQGTLGSEGAEAYVQRSRWLGLLKGGNAFSTNAKDSSGGPRGMDGAVFPVSPPRSARPASAPAAPRG